LNPERLRSQPGMGQAAGICGAKAMPEVSSSSISDAPSVDVATHLNSAQFVTTEYANLLAKIKSR
jgi:hypothetical protein